MASRNGLHSALVLAKNWPFWASTLSHIMCARKQTAEPKLLILVSVFSGEVTLYINCMPFRFFFLGGGPPCIWYYPICIVNELFNDIISMQNQPVNTKNKTKNKQKNIYKQETSRNPMQDISSANSHIFPQKIVLPFFLMLSHPVVSWLILSHLILSYLILSYLTVLLHQCTLAQLVLVAHFCTMAQWVRLISQLLIFTVHCEPLSL